MNRFLKQKLCFLLCICLLAASSFVGFADGAVFIEMDNQEVSVGDDLEIPVYISDMAGIKSMQFTINYPQGFTPVITSDNIDMQAELDPGLVFENLSVKGCRYVQESNRFNLALSGIADMATTHQQVVTMRFDVSSELVTGEYNFTASRIIITNADGSQMDFDAKNACITVNNPDKPRPEPSKNPDEDLPPFEQWPWGTPTPTPDKPTPTPTGTNTNTPTATPTQTSGTPGGTPGGNQATPTPTKTPVPTPSTQPEGDLNRINQLTDNAVASITEIGQTLAQDEQYKVSDIVQETYQQLGSVSISAERVPQSAETASVTLNGNDFDMAAYGLSYARSKLAPVMNELNIANQPQTVLDCAIPASSALQLLTVQFEPGTMEKLTGNGIDALRISNNMFDVIIQKDAFSALQSGGIQFKKTPAAQADSFALQDGSFVYELVTSASIAGKAEVSVPYTLKTGETEYSVVAAMANTSGEITKAFDSRYQDGAVTFSLAQQQPFAILSEQVTFHDMGSAPWAVDFVQGLAVRGIVSGAGENMFLPDKNVTREEFTKMIIGAFGLLDTSASTQLSDVPSDAWYYPYIASAQKLGIVNGIGDNLFGVGTPITRQDMAVIAVRAANAAGKTIRKAVPAEQFTDAASIAGYAAENISLVQQAGIISGMGNGSFAPQSNATRAQAAKVIYMLFALD